MEIDDKDLQHLDPQNRVDLIRQMQELAQAGDRAPDNPGSTGVDGVNSDPAERKDIVAVNGVSEMSPTELPPDEADGTGDPDRETIAHGQQDRGEEWAGFSGAADDAERPLTPEELAAREREKQQQQAEGVFNIGDIQNADMINRGKIGG